MPNKAQYEIDPPIKDTNRNGVLDSSEILSQLKAEEKQGSVRVASERVHGVLSNFGFLDLVKQFNELSVTGVLKHDTAQQMVTLTEQRINEAVNWDEKTRKGIINHFSSRARSSVEQADLKSLEDFIVTFKKTFPNGVKLDQKDIPEILTHFGELKYWKSAPPPSNGYKKTSFRDL